MKNLFNIFFTKEFVKFFCVLFSVMAIYSMFLVWFVTNYSPYAKPIVKIERIEKIEKPFNRNLSESINIAEDMLEWLEWDIAEERIDKEIGVLYIQNLEWQIEYLKEGM